MEFKYYFLPYFFWLLFNRSLLFENIKKKTVNGLILLENKNRYFYYLRYPLTICAACFSFWCNLFVTVYSIAPEVSIISEITSICLVFVLIFTVETFVALLSKIK